MKRFMVAVVLALLCSGCLVGEVWGMGLKAGGFQLNLDEMKAGILQDFKSGKSLGCFALPALEKTVGGLPVTLSLAGIGNSDKTFEPSALRLGGIISVDGQSLAEKFGMVYKLPENVALGFCLSYAHQECIFGLFAALGF